MDERETKTTEIFRERIFDSALMAGIIAAYGKQFADDILIAVALTAITTSEEDSPAVSIIGSAVHRYVNMMSKVYDVPMEDMRTMGKALMTMIIKVKNDVGEEHGRG